VLREIANREARREAGNRTETEVWRFNGNKEGSMATSAIFHHALAAGQAQAAQAATPLDTTTPGTGGASSAADDSSTSSGSATISANDFLTLLVTEMQNQDPTADTDPNEYINQLVQVNSLEQLIDINQTLSGDASGSADSTSTSSSSASSPASNSPASTSSATSAAPGASNANPVSGGQAARVGQTPAPPSWSPTPQIMKAMHMSGGPSLGSTGIAPSGLQAGHAQAATIGGNLGLQKTNPAATRVGHALAGRTHAAAGTATPKAN
jgi:flagellar basal-body rod modification protein FlgD